MIKNKSTEKSIVSGAFILGISGIVVKALGFIYKIPLSYILSDEGMGYFNTAYTVYTFFYLVCTAGVPKAVSILISRAQADGEPGKSEEVFKTALTMFLVFGTITTIILMISANWIAEFIGSNQTYMTILSVAPSILFVCASGVIRGYFNGKISMLPIAVSEVISGVAKLVIGLILAIFGYRFGLGLHLISALTILGVTIGSFIGFVYLLACYKKENVDNIIGQNTKTKIFSMRKAKEIFSISLPLTITSVTASVAGLIDTVIIIKSLKLSGYTELQTSIIYGNYTTLVVPMMNLVGALIAPLSAVALPLVTKKAIRLNRESISQDVCICIKLVSCIVFPLATIFIMSSTEILSLVFEDSSAILAAPLLCIIAPGIIFMALLTVINTSLEGMGNIRVPLISLIFGNVIKLVVSFLLIGKSSFGILGAPIGTVLSYIVSFMISLIVLIKGEKIKIKFFDVIILPMILSSTCGAFYFLLKNKFTFTGVADFIIHLALFCLFYLILMFLFAFYEIKKGKILSKYTKIQR